MAAKLGHISSVAYDFRTAAEFASTTRFDMVIVNVHSGPDSSAVLGDAIARRGSSKDPLIVSVFSSDSRNRNSALHIDRRIEEPLRAEQLEEICLRASATPGLG